MFSIKSIIDGYLNFKRTLFPSSKQEFVNLINKGQHPKSLLISCSDSRIQPSSLFSTPPGTFFYVRNVGNLVPHSDHKDTLIETLSGIEFAVHHLKIKNIIVMGHEKCGACAALHSPPSKEVTPALCKWLEINRKTKNMVDSALIKDPSLDIEQLTETTSIVNQLENLMSYDFIKELVNKNQLTLHGWYYNIKDGNVSYYDDEGKCFLPLENFKLDES